MLIRFNVSNWMSFQDDTQFSMEGTEIEQFNDRLPRIEKFQLSILPVSMIFGGNASGKSNFVKSLRFAQQFIVEGTKPGAPIEVKPFLLVNEYTDTKFEFAILVDENIYEYSFSVNQERVTEEKLVYIDSTREKVLFHRNSQRTNIEFDESVPPKNKDFLNYIAQGTRNNQLFLTNSIFQNEELYKPVYDWFSDSLLVLGPESSFHRTDVFFDSKHPFTVVLNEAIPKLDFGISSIQGTRIPYNQIWLPNEIRAQLEKDLKNNYWVTLEYEGNLYMFSRIQSEIVVEKMVTTHTNSKGNEVLFEFSQESDGTRRVVDLLPAFFSLYNLKKVLVIDEVDRSIHPLLIQRIFESFLMKCDSNFRSQLICTSHNVELINAHVIRPDEIWVTDKNSDGVTKLNSLSDFKGIEEVDDYLKRFLEGRFGGIPHVQVGGIFDLPEYS